MYISDIIANLISIIEPKLKRTQMSLFRSAQMKFFHINIPKENTYELISKFAQNNFLQFVDLSTNPFHRPYFAQVKRCEEVIAKIQITLKKVHQEGIAMPEVPLVDFVFENHRQYLKYKQMTAQNLLDKIQEQVEAKYENIQKTHRSLSEFIIKINELQDYKYLLFKARQVFHTSSLGPSEINVQKNSLQQLRLMNISGVLQSKDLLKFTKMIFRATKGNNILYTFDIPRQYQQYKSYSPRTAFICIVQTGGILISKINRICQSFGAKKYKIPINKEEIFNKIKQIQDNITDTKQLYVMAQKNYRQDLHTVIEDGDFGCSGFDAFRILLERESIILSTMNFMEESGNILLGGIWVPTDKVGLLYKITPSYVSIRVGDPETQPPTNFQTNQFIAPFQQIVNTYGVPRYQQINPTLFAIPVFPFLFGVMFGDIGHGGILLGFSVWLIVAKIAKRLIPEVYKVRYLLLLMGIFSFYSGWIYNQFFSIPINLFGTCYQTASSEEQAQKIYGCVYPFGFDPKWIRASNELNYFNSYKMKFAVIIGVFQMSFAILLKMMNSYYFRNYLDFFFEWIPQQVFFFCTFGYMCIIIVYKWIIPWGIQTDSALAPSIIGQMIALPLKLGSTQGKPLWDIQSQQSIQYTLLIISLICIPMMLIPKPLIIWIQWRWQTKQDRKINRSVDQTSQAFQLRKKLNQQFDVQADQNLQNQRSSGYSNINGHDQHDISQIAVHQIIETIQFILGSISNTASYLRLWALSLAHGQLSRVFLEKTIGGGIETGNILVIIVGMFLFTNITLGVIMGMDLMECFLHGLRLQWVEIQNKFFKADGWKFKALTFREPIQQKANESRIFQ